MIEALWLYHCGYFRAPRSAITPGTGILRWGRYPFLGLAALHSSRGLVLIDAPFGHDGPKNFGALLGGALSASVLEFEPSWSIVPRIEQIGHRCSEIDEILMTHLHVDHTGGMKELVHAIFHIERGEWEDATMIGAIEARRRGYAQADYRALGARVDPFDAPPPLSETLPGEGAGLDLFGDGSIHAVSLPGHTPNHVGYMIHLADGRTLLHAGDAALAVSQITGRTGVGPLFRRLCEDEASALFTLRALQHFHEERPEIEIICAHDEALGVRVADGPVQL